MTPRFASQRIEIGTDPESARKPLIRSLEPAQVITGHVTDAVSGKPILHAMLNVTSNKADSGYSRSFVTDGEGIFRVVLESCDSLTVAAYPPDESPNLYLSRHFASVKEATASPIDLRLPRGVVIRGKISEDGTGVPVSGATIRFIPRSTKDNGADTSGRPIPSRALTARSRSQHCPDRAIFPSRDPVTIMY